MKVNMFPHAYHIFVFRSKSKIGIKKIIFYFLKTKLFFQNNFPFPKVFEIEIISENVM